MSLLPALLAAALFAAFAGAVPAVLGGETLRWGVDWIPSLGIRLSFAVDGLSLIFALLISGIGALVMLYARTYMAGHPQAGRFFWFLTAFMLSMLGLVLAADLIALFVFWELTSVTSYLLIGFAHDKPEARRAALQAMLVTAAGGLAMLAGFILIGSVAGTFDLSAINAAGDLLRDGGLYLPILVLVLIGAFTKSAQFPFHFWLPNAMAAPTPVSAYLHSATMVKGGVYLLARLAPSLGGTEVWFWTLAGFGGFTAVLASVLALRQTDLKQALAYTTLMALGTITLFLAIPTAYAMTAAVTFLIVHSLYKATLFLVVGIIDHETGTRDIRRLGGLARAMPITAVAAALAGLSMAGLPPLIGWIGKELLYVGALSAPVGASVIAAAALAANALMFAVAGIVALRPFRGQALPEALPKLPHEAPAPMLAGPVVLALCGALAGLAPERLMQALVNSGVTSVSGGTVQAAGLHLWAGLNAAFWLSLTTFALGTVIYLLRDRLRAELDRLALSLPDFDRGWDRLLAGFRVLAAEVSQLVQPGLLSRYLTGVFLTVLLALGGTFLLRGSLPAFGLPANILLWVIMVFVTAGAALAVFTLHRITVIAGLGTVGIGVALIFILFGAPDVAITQLMVETLVVVMFAVAALRLPRMTELRGRATRLWHASLAVGIGATTTAIVLAITARPLDRRLTDFFESASYSEAHGLNIVNVILVDFRGLDTFGEISVVLIAAIGAYALLRTRKGEAH